MTENPLSPSRRSNIDPFVVMDMFRAASEQVSLGNDIIRMEAGQPAAGAPKAVIDAARRGLDENKIGYTEALGIPALRERISDLYRQRYDLNIPAGRIVVTTGSSGGFLLAFLSLFDPGARVALPSPGYPAYRNILESLNIETIAIDTNAANRWMPTVEDLDLLALEKPLNGLLLASPANPTGTMIGRERLKDLARACAERNIWLISDEIYHGLTYEEPGVCALEYNDDAIVINSFSKYFSMTGWRIGWMVVPDRMMRPVECLAQNHFISPPSLSQTAALAAFDAIEECERIKSVYAANRALLLEELPKAGLDQFMPVDGAFYLYADIRKFSNDSHDFAQRLLKEAGISVTPGVDFDRTRGNQYVRLSFAGATNEMREAAKRFKTWLA